jgi:hypothetical protein
MEYAQLNTEQEEYLAEMAMERYYEQKAEENEANKNNT